MPRTPKMSLWKTKVDAEGNGEMYKSFPAGLQ